MTTDQLPAAGPPTIRATRPADILGVIPYLLGFVPAEDVVVVLLRRPTVVLTARVDLASVATPRALAEMIEDLADLHGADSVVVVGYHDDVEAVAPVLDQLPDHLDGVHVVDLLHVDGGRWYSRLCRDDSCCPAEGTPFDHTASRTAAEAVYAGLTTLPSREELRRITLAPTDRMEERRTLFDQVAGELLPAAVGLSEHVLARVETLLESGRLPEEDECAELAVAMYDLDVRHEVWMQQRRSHAAAGVRLWARVAAQTIEPFRTAPLCQLATAGWLSGDGALMSVCLDTLVQTDPDARLVGTLDTIQRLSLAPSWWDEAVTES